MNRRSLAGPLAAIALALAAAAEIAAPSWSGPRTIARPTCPAKVVPFLKEPFASEFLALLVEHRDMLQASFSGHTHFDDYRLLIDERGTVIGTDKVTPGISPIFGQNPGFQVFTYDRWSGAPRDFSTWYLVNPGAAPRAADWQFEYTFTTAYGQAEYSPDAVKAVWKAMSNDGAVQETIADSTLSDAARLRPPRSRPIRAPWAIWTDRPSPRATAEIAVRLGRSSKRHDWILRSIVIAGCARMQVAIATRQAHRRDIRSI